MWRLKDKYKECCQNEDCEFFDACIDCWDEWAERNPPMTNADRIRAMSDEELARWVMQFVFDSFVASGIEDPHWEDGMAEAMLKWLKQPASEPPKEEAQQDCTYNKNGHCMGQKLMPECDAKNCDRRK